MNELIEQLSREYKLDQRVIRLIVYNPLRFLKQSVLSNDINPFRLSYMGVFNLKRRDGKYRLAKNRINKILKLEHAKLLIYLDIFSTDLLKDFLFKLLEDNNYKAIEDLYKKLHGVNPEKLL
jgi:hypothetical protein